MATEELQTLTVKQVAQLLNIHRVRCYQLIREGKLPAIRLGKSVRVRAEALKRWLEEQETRPQW